MKQSRNKTTKKVQKTISHQVNKRPIVYVLVVLVQVVILIIIGNQIRTPQIQSVEQSTPIKSVDIYAVGQAPTYQTTAQADKQSVITINSLTPGIISRIYISAGEQVQPGQRLAYIASNYQGGNPASIQRQIAQKQYQFNLDTAELQKETISTQRQIALKTDSNSDQLRQIQSQSQSNLDTQLSLNQEILQTIDSQLKTLENATDSASQTLAFQTKQLKGQYLAAIGQLESTKRNLDYQSNTANPPSELQTLQRDLALKSLDLQEKSLDLQQEISLLSLKLAQVAESTSFPSTPVAGIVERIFVRPFQAVSPGTPIAIITSDEGSIVLTAQVPSSIAQQISKYDAATLIIQNKPLSIVPSHISTQSTVGNLHTITYHLPTNTQVNQGEYLPIEIPLGSADTSATIPFIPIDAVHQNASGSFVYLAQNGKAQSSQIEIGEVIGSLVEVTSGLKSGDLVILQRNVIQGDQISID